MSALVIGVDIGLCGALALLTSEGVLVDVVDMPCRSLRTAPRGAGR